MIMFSTALWSNSNFYAYLDIFFKVISMCILSMLCFMCIIVKIFPSSCRCAFSCVPTQNMKKCISAKHVELQWVMCMSLTHKLSIFFSSLWLNWPLSKSSWFSFCCIKPGFLDVTMVTSNLRRNRIVQYLVGVVLCFLEALLTDNRGS